MRRPFCSEDSTDRRLKFKNVVRNVIGQISETRVMVTVEALFRKVVREEIDRLIEPFLHQFQRQPFNHTETSKSSSGLRLRFINAVPNSIFTGSKIEAEEGIPISIELVDASTNTRVVSGPESSIKIEIVPLDGDFSQNDWHKEEFDKFIVPERRGRKPLVIGDLSITLCEGVGHIGNVSFTDNSRWMRSGRFRLGARIPHRSRPCDLEVREARSMAFKVKDHRGEAYKKHYPPSPCDYVWRLKKIAKDRTFHSRLAEHGIYTVKDFLWKYKTKRNALRNILGNKGDIPNRTWSVIVEHALSCVPNDEYYLYDGNFHGAASLLFDSTYEVVQASFDARGFLHVEQLNLTEMHEVERSKQQAFANAHQHDLKRFNGPLPTPLDELVQLESSSPLPVDCRTTHQEAEQQIGVNQSFVSPSYNHVPGHDYHSLQAMPPALINSFKSEDLTEMSMHIDLSSLQTSHNHVADHGCHLFQMSCPEQRHSFSSREQSQGLTSFNLSAASTSTSCNVFDPNFRTFSPALRNSFEMDGFIPRTCDFGGNPILRQFSGKWSPVENNFLFASSGEPDRGISNTPSFDIYISRTGRPRARWCKIRAVLKVRSALRATQKAKRSMYIQY